MNWSSVLPLIAAYTPARLALAAGLYFNDKRLDDSRESWRAELRRIEER